MNKLEFVTHEVCQIVKCNSTGVVALKDRHLRDIKFNTISGRHEIECFFGTEFEQEQVDAWTTVQNIIDDVMNLWVAPITDPVCHKIGMGKTYGQSKTEEINDLGNNPLMQKEMDDLAEWHDKTTKAQAKMRLNAELPLHATKDFKFYDPDLASKITEDGKKALNNMPVINSLSRQDVKEFDEWIDENNSRHINNLDHYQKLATKSAIYPGQGTPLGLDYIALKLNGEAGEFAEHVGKAMRDDNLMQIVDEPFQNGDVLMRFKPLTDDRRALIIKEASDVLWYLSAACNELGISISELALTNLKKLADRTERNQLRGSGDNR